MGAVRMTSDLVSPRESEGKAARELSPEQAAAAAMVAEAKARRPALTGPDLKLFTKEGAGNRAGRGAD
jgi:putative transposase